MLSIGIDLGGTNIACGIVDENGHVLKKGSRKTGAERPAALIVKDMADLAASLMNELQAKPRDAAFLGVAAPGVANVDRGVIEYSCNLPTFRSFSLMSELKKALGVERAALENDANCAAIGEAAVGSAKGTRSSILVTLGTGVGGGIILDGKILHGINFSAGEIGHMVIVQNGLPCSCGRRGCFEQYASARALCRLTREAMEKHPDSVMWGICGGSVDNVSGRTVFQALRENDPAAAEALNTYIQYLALGITNLVNIFQPEIVSVGGGISAEGETLFAPVREILEREQYSRFSERKTVLKKAELGNDAGIIGAALLWRNQ